MTDASDFALGAVLSQVQEGVERPIAFASRTLNATECKYATNEKEALAIIWAVKKYQAYLYGNRFTLITDHKPLTFIKTSEKNSKILRWRLELENFDYDVIYKEGKTNVVADALSRIPAVEGTSEINFNEETSTTSRKSGRTTDSSNNNNSGNSPQNQSNTTGDSDTVHSANTSDEYFIHISERPVNYYRNQILFKIANIDTIMTEKIFPKYNRTIIVKPTFNKEDITYIMKNYHSGKQSAILAPENLHGIIQESFRENFSIKGHFVFVTKIVEDVTSEIRQDSIIIREHERAHRGTQEVEKQIRRSYFFPNIVKKIKSYTNSCNVCNRHKYDRRPYNIKISPRPKQHKPLERIHVDIFSINKSSIKHLQMIEIKSKT